MMPRVRQRHPLLRLVLLACALEAFVVPAAGAAPATLTTDFRCYLQGALLRMTASGLTPNAPLTVALDGQQLRYGNGSTPAADAAGSFVSSFTTQSLLPGVPQQRHVLAVSDGTRRPRARFTVTRPAGADFQPSSGNPRTLRARFRVWGFALAGGTSRVPVWLHWISPAGRVRENAPLGMTSGACGMLTTTPRRVFPFDAEAGRWVLVLDTRRRYRVQPSGPRAKIPVHLRPISP